MFGIGMTRLAQEFDDALALKVAGSADGEHPFHVTRSPLALRTEAGFTPDDSLADTALGRVIGRFNLLVIDKRPQVLPQLPNLTAFTGKRSFVTVRILIALFPKLNM